MTLLKTLKLALAASAFVAAAGHAGVVAGFDDLASLPAVDSATGLEYANGSFGLSYMGATWDSDFYVVGDAYSVGAGGPTFGVPHSGHYFVSNHSGKTGVTIATDQVLTGAWFGRNQYYGFGEGGADKVTIVALSGATELGAVDFELPESHAGLAEPLSFVDTSVFLSYAGITGYRIDRRELGQQSGNWVADDFQFEQARQVPVPGTLTLMLAGLGLLGFARRRG
jgi:hypothetical protein